MLGPYGIDIKKRKAKTKAAIAFVFALLLKSYDYNPRKFCLSYRSCPFYS